ncbi:GNAT family N-acetyltransferase [Microbispora sp. NBC_01189]|uniref:GNAT family N-acetyltransferase n=1 Tax=Microbispora sp. NBC_01189 TaxID=2903583 RepID=UPI002E12C057|nr:GNAT family N-acetyltransferase [Microbispora sp. NBC_01189]
MGSTISPVVAPGAMRRLPQPSLPAGDLLLRPWTPGDAGQVLDAFRDAEIQRWHRVAMTTHEEALAWVGRWAGAWEAETAAGWAVTDAVTGAVLGRVGLRDMDLPEGRAEVGYWVLPAARGRGVAVRAVSAAVRWGFEGLGLHRLELQHSTRNHASCRVAGKAGFAVEGVLRAALLHADGWHDMEVHALLNA